MQTTMTRKEMEQRRIDAVSRIGQAGQRNLSKELGVSRTTICRWRRALKEGGSKALKARPAPGRPSRLTSAQISKLRDLYRSRPAWSGKQFQYEVEQRCGVRYSRDHAYRLMQRLGREPRNYRRTVLPADLQGAAVGRAAAERTA